MKFEKNNIVVYKKDEIIFSDIFLIILGFEMSNQTYYDLKSIKDNKKVLNVNEKLLMFHPRPKTVV